MDEELAAILVAMTVQPLVITSLVLADRRRLDEYGRARMWNEATLGTAMNPLLFPLPAFGLGAHVWITRPGPWWSPLRLGKALVAAVLGEALAVLGMYLVLLLIEATIGFSH